MIEPNGVKTSVKRAAAALALLCFFSGALAAQSRGFRHKIANENVDYAAMRPDILRFEVALNEAIVTYSRGPFSVVNRAKGAYLPGFGINFTFLIDVQRAILGMPFGEIRRKQATTEQKKQWIEDLKERLIRLMQEKGNGFQQLRREDYVTIVAFLDDRSFLEPSANKTIVLRVPKKDLDELGKNRDQLPEFKQRIKIFEY
jgi:hypothetical protein